MQLDLVIEQVDKPILKVPSIKKLEPQTLKLED
jgi:hypothetical protein